MRHANAAATRPVEPRRVPVVGRGVAFWLIGYAFFAVMLGTTLPTPLYPLYEQRYGLTPTLVTVVFATYAVGVIAALLLFGRLSDVIGRRPLLFAGIAFSALSAVVFLVAQDSALLYLGRMLSGFSAGIFTGTATAAMLDLVPGDRRGYATAVAVACNLGGLATGPLLAGLLAQWAPDPLRLCFVADLILLVPAFAGVLVAPETVNTAGQRVRFVVQRLRVPAQVRVVFWQAVIAGFGAFAVSGLYGAVAPTLLARLIGITSHAVAGTIVFSLLAASAAGQVIVRRMPWRSGLIAGCVVLIAGLALLLLALVFSSVAALSAAALVAGLGQGLAMGAGLAAVNARVPQEQRGEVASTYFVGVYTGLIIPVVGVGLLADALGLRAAGVLFTALVGAAVLGVLVTLARTES